ncbi:rod shape-determining protein MreC [Enterobacteriaceae endosymbiont of Plateumaris sericea]|uniref:rod shape-determining protein MreC n=1 Tax=Enterobacteriaceae endosymbiont of Plateumaris sericea TaxID=2675797 RepID=UPI00144936F7|nr:rod shape-determining protein MreC [Enterobacteriaceae endosymbiont of Plateumaris sericea]QJC29771.1 rod shape-determining protein MreC [Enterobacteriaceae endosymbiont of Plateumaris sericea]
MKNFFNKKIKSKTKIICIILLLLFFLIINYFFNLKPFVDILINPINILLNKSYSQFNNLIDIRHINNNLKKENKHLYHQILKKEYDLIQLQKIKHDNQKLKELLDIPIFTKSYIKKIFVEKLPINFNFYSDEILINKGSIHNIHKGQLVINRFGLVGQVIYTNKLTSHVRLICSTKSFISIKSTNSNIKFIIKGNGCKSDLISEILPKNINIKKGDILVISALYNNLLQEYPVAIVTATTNDDLKSRGLNFINASPLFKITELKYLLLIS